MVNMSFTSLPQDMLQYEISRFLNPLSRAEFNCVLKPDEYVFMKLPADYALMHHIRIVKKAYEENCAIADRALDNMGFNPRESNVKLAIKNLNNIFKIFTNPVNLLAVSYQKKLKDILLNLATVWQRDTELVLYSFMSKELKKNARLMEIAVQATPFMRHIKIQEFKTIY